MERAERMVRHLRSAIVRLTNDVAPVGPLEVAALIEALSESSDWQAESNEEGEVLLERIRVEAVSFIFDDDRPDGLCHTLESLRRTGAAIRDRISIDSGRIINQLHPTTLFGRPIEGARAGDLLTLLNQMVTLLSAFSGLATESMTRRKAGVSSTSAAASSGRSKRSTSSGARSSTCGRMSSRRSRPSSKSPTAR